MKKKPIFVIIVSIFYFLSPIWYFLQLVVDPRVTKFSNVFTKIANNPDLLYTSVMIFWAIGVGVGVFLVTRWGFWLFVGNSAWNTISWVILFVRFKVPIYYIILGTMGIVATFVVVAALLRKSILSPFFNPRLRWWKNPPRFIVDESDNITTEFNNKLCKVYDINEFGCFLIGDEFYKDHDINENVNFFVSINNEKIHITGEVVWINKPTNNIDKPIGMGIKFTHMNSEDKNRLKKVMKDMKTEKQKKQLVR